MGLRPHSRLVWGWLNIELGFFAVAIPIPALQLGCVLVGVVVAIVG